MTPSTHLTPQIELPPFRSYLRLESIDPEQNRRRFYLLQWRPTLWDGKALIRTWGRLGTPGFSLVMGFGHQPQAQAAISRVVRRRLKHGYQLVGWQ